MFVKTGWIPPRPDQTLTFIHFIFVIELSRKFYKSRFLKQNVLFLTVFVSFVDVFWQLWVESPDCCASEGWSVPWCWKVKQVRTHLKVFGSCWCWYKVTLSLIESSSILKSSKRGKLWKTQYFASVELGEINLLSPFPSCLELGIAVLLPAQVLLPDGDEDEDEGDCDDNGGDDENNGDHWWWFSLTPTSALITALASIP